MSCILRIHRNKISLLNIVFKKSQNELIYIAVRNIESNLFVYFRCFCILPTKTLLNDISLSNI